MRVRDAQPGDWEAIWPFFADVVRAGETLAYDRDIGEDDARRMWMIEPPGRTVVAVDDEGVVVGTANMYANRPGGGSHVASGSFIVDPGRWGEGAGRALGEEVIAWAKEAGFRAVQFNAVVETNERSVALWQSLGFDIVGTVPEAFRHPAHGYVGLHVMYRRL